MVESSINQKDIVMKTTVVSCLGMMILVSQPLLALDEARTAGRFITVAIEQSEKSLKTALEAPSPGLQLSAANTTRQLKELLPNREFSSLIIPLMRIVKDEDAGTTHRIVAAIALHELHSGKGDFAIARTAKFTENPGVKNICLWLAYNQKLSEKREIPVVVPKIQAFFEQYAPEPLPELAF